MKVKNFSYQKPTFSSFELKPKPIVEKKINLTKNLKSCIQISLLWMKRLKTIILHFNFMGFVVFIFSLLYSSSISFALYFAYKIFAYLFNIYSSIHPPVLHHQGFSPIYIFIYWKYFSVTHIHTSAHIAVFVCVGVGTR